MTTTKSHAGDGAPAPPGSINRECSEWWEPIIPEGSDVPSEVTIHELLDSKFYEKEKSLC